MGAPALGEVQGAGEHRPFTGAVHHDLSMGSEVDWLLEGDSWSGPLGAGRVKGAQTRSCSSAVLMEESAEQVASTHGAPVILGADGRPGQRIWWSQPEWPG